MLLITILSEVALIPDAPVIDSEGAGIVPSQSLEGFLVSFREGNDGMNVKYAF